MEKEYQAPTAADPPDERKPLWEVMSDSLKCVPGATVVASADHFAQLCYAAEIRAVRDWIEKRQVDGYAVTLPDVREVIEWLTAEADRAERGDG